MLGGQQGRAGITSIPARPIVSHSVAPHVRKLRVPYRLLVLRNKLAR